MNTPIIIEDVEIYGLERMKKTSGYPKSWNPEPSENRLITLGKATPSSGHDCALKGVKVFVTLTADHSFWCQFQRYHFHDITSSTSKMHSLAEMELIFHPKTLKHVQDGAVKLQQQYKEGKIDFEELVLSMPIGLALKADTETNYLQLKTIWYQRKTHKMSSWVQYCNWIETLPMMKSFLKI